MTEEGFKYIGGFKNGNPHGKGTVIGVNGNSYTQEFKDGEFVGDFKDGEFFQKEL